MGSETPPEVLIPSVLNVIQKWPSFSFLLYLPETLSVPTLENVTVITCSQKIAMDDEPRKAIKQNPKSSLVQALKGISAGDGFISCCNTGAFVLASGLYVSKLPGVHRPALVAEMSLLQSPVYILDVGGTAQRAAQQLQEWAYLGKGYAEARGTRSPKIGLLNIGVEEMKGAEEHREVVEKLFSMSHFVGNIEPQDILSGKVDVVVTDGFSGNILLKSFEAISLYWLSQMPKGDVRTSIQSKMSDSMQQGALLVGYEAYLMKCHGSSSQDTFAGALTKLLSLMERSTIDKLKEHLLVGQA